MKFDNIFNEKNVIAGILSSVKKRNINEKDILLWQLFLKTQINSNIKDISNQYQPIDQLKNCLIFF